jgi:hypothetical protein
MTVPRLSRALIAGGVLFLAASFGLGLAGVSIDQASGQEILGGAGSADVGPDFGGADPDAAAEAGAAGGTAGTELPFTGGGALYVALTGIALIAAGLVTRRFGLAD